MLLLRLWLSVNVCVFGGVFDWFGVCCVSVFDVVSCRLNCMLLSGVVSCWLSCWLLCVFVLFVLFVRG